MMRIELTVIFDEQGASDGTVHVTVFPDKATGHIHRGPSGKYQWSHCRAGEEAQTSKADSLQEAQKQMRAAHAKETQTEREADK